MIWSPTIQYLAGFFDGEGCAEVRRYANKSGTYSYLVGVSASQNSREVLEFFVERFGGKIEKHGKRAYRWRLYGKYCYDFLIAMIPHLIVKQEQCVLLLRMLQHKGDRRWTNYDYEYLTWIYDNVRGLKYV